MKIYLPLYVVLILLLLITPACNAPFNRAGTLQDGSQDEGQAGIPPVTSTGLIPGSTFILVVDPDGDPIINARVGESDLYTDRNGVAVGSIATTAGGWFSVYAPGFATTDSRAITQWEGYPVALTILTPLGPSTLVEPDSITILKVENSRREQAHIQIEAGSFSEKQVIMSWSDIPLTQLDARFGDFSAMEDLRLQGAFAVEAASLEGETLDLGSNGSVTLHITWDPERDEIPVIGSFNNTTGAWELLDDHCQLDEEASMECTLPHLSEFGLFGHSPGGSGWEDDDDTEDDGFSNSFGSALDNAMGGGAGGAAGGGGAAGAGAEGGGESGGDGGGLTGGLDGLSGSGEGLGTEVDKMTALIAAGLAMENGLDSLANQYLDQAREAIKDMAEKLLKDPSCGTVYEMLTAASQAWLVGGLDALGDQLIEEAQDILKRCGVWYGTIHYTYKLSESWPHANEWQHESGSQDWTEVHEVKIYVDPKTGVLDGESHVHLAFGNATYRYEEETRCGPIRNDHETKTDPGNGKAVLLFEGTFDGENFKIGELRLDNSEPLKLQHHAWYSRTFAPAPPPQCPPVTTKEISTQDIAEYTSQLIHGFFGQPEPPSLQEMLSSGDRRYDSSDRVISISGNKNLSYEVGQNLSPLLPVQSGSVNWSFTRVTEGAP
jgi:hypothetical protein